MKILLKRVFALTFVLAMVCSISAGAISEIEAPVSTERTIINKEVAPGVILLDEGYDSDFGFYTFTRTYQVTIWGTQSTFVMQDRNTDEYDGVWVKLVDDASTGSSPVTFSIDEYPRSGTGVKKYAHSFTLSEGGEKATKLSDPSGCTYSLYAKFTSSAANGKVTIKVSCDDYETMD